LFTPRNAPEASRYVREIIESVKRQEQMSEAALKSVQTRTWRNSSDEVRAQYQQVISEFQLLSQSQIENRRPGMMATLLTKALVRLFQLMAPGKTKPAVNIETSRMHQHAGSSV
jgi:hypothetical protein